MTARPLKSAQELAGGNIKGVEQSRRMTFERAFRLSIYLLLFSGFASLLVSEAVGAWLAIAYLGAILASSGFDEIHIHNRWLQLFISLGLFAFFLADMMALSGLVQSSIHLLILISLFKLYTRKQNRDYLLLFCVSFTFLLIASTFTISISFLICLVGFFFVSILSFLLFESKTAYSENRNAYFSFRAYALLALLTTLLIAAVSVPFFLAIPRTAFGFFRMDDQAGANLSGFSDQVNLGDIGRIITNRDVFMRVQVDGESPESLPADLKWRGITLDHYDGKAWRNTRSHYQYLSRASPRTGFLVPVQRRERENQITQSITVEHPTHVVFGADRILWIAGPGFPQRIILRDENDSLSFYSNVPESFRYTVTSDVMERGQRLSQVTEGRVPREFQGRYLQLPTLRPEIRTLAEEVTADQPSDLGKALVLERYLRENFEYTLDNPSGRAPDPLAHFLLVSKAGHCEYFATAMAVMLRILGIPSRVVNGFRRGEFNQWSGHFVVRQSDAHSWVEAWFPGGGWIEFDPTPAVASPRDFYVTHLASQMLDAIEVFWNEILTFDHFKQIGFFRSMASTIRSSISSALASAKSVDDGVTSFLERLKSWPYGIPIGILALLLLAATGILLWRYRKYLLILIRQNLLRKSPAKLAPSYYLELLDLLERKGLKRKAGETPAEFAQRVSPLLGSPLPVQLTHLYYRTRYGNLPMAPAELESIRRSLRQLRSLKVMG